MDVGLFVSKSFRNEAVGMFQSDTKPRTVLFRCWQKNILFEQFPPKPLESIYLMGMLGQIAIQNSVFRQQVALPQSVGIETHIL